MIARQEPNKTVIGPGQELSRLETTLRSGGGIGRSVGEETDAFFRSFESLPPDGLLAQARVLREQGHGRTICYAGGHSEFRSRRRSWAFDPRRYAGEALR
jgi:hypothetical protein